MFWKEVWVGSVPSIELFPRLVALDVDSNCVVADRRHGNNCNWCWRYDMRGGAQTSQFSAMVELLANVQFWDSKDSWVWNPANNVDFFGESDVSDN